VVGSLRRWMPAPSAPRTRATAALLFVLAVATAACGGSGGEQQAVPVGFTTYQAARYSIAYPAGWMSSERPNTAGGPPTVVIQGPNGSGGFAPQIAIGHDTDYASDFDDALEVFRLVAVGQTGTVVSDQPIQLAGAARAQRTEYTEPNQGTDGQQYTIRIVEIHTLTADRTMYDVLVRAPQQDFDRAQLLTALNSFQVRSP
jgi:hypothetical protein